MRFQSWIEVGSSGTKGIKPRGIRYSLEGVNSSDDLYLPSMMAAGTLESFSSMTDASAGPLARALLFRSRCTAASASYLSNVVSWLTAPKLSTSHAPCWSSVMGFGQWVLRKQDHCRGE